MLNIYTIDYFNQYIIDILTCKKYSLKSYIIDNNIHKEVNHIRKQQYIMSMCDFKVDDTIKNINSFIDYYSLDIFNIADKLNKNKYKRNSRLKKRIKSMLDKGNCLFLTLTFTDIVLNTTTYDIRRRYIREFLNSYSSYYIANIDFGEKKGREHYHAILLADKVNNRSWRYGAINFKKIKTDKKSIEAVSLYVNKLTVHALKKTTGNNFKIIYSRDCSKL